MREVFNACIHVFGGIVAVARGVFSLWPLTAVAMVLWVITAADRSDATAELLDAAAEGNAARIEKALARGADVGRKEDGTGLTPLMLAARRGNSVAVALLIDKGAAVNAAAPAYGSVISTGVMGGDADVVRVLIRGGADPNADTGTGWVPLKLALLFGNKEIVDAIRQAGAVDEQAGAKDSTPASNDRRCAENLRLLGEF